VVLLTRATPKLQVFDGPSSDHTFTVYGASFKHVAAPAKPLAGTVRDKDTGKPLAGVRIDVMGPLVQATTDKEGKFRLRSLPGGRLRCPGRLRVAGAGRPAAGPALPGRLPEGAPAPGAGGHAAGLRAESGRLGGGHGHEQGHGQAGEGARRVPPRPRQPPAE